jgi:hypothetical protein
MMATILACTLLKTRLISNVLADSPKAKLKAGPEVAICCLLLEIYK